MQFTLNEYNISILKRFASSFFVREWNSLPKSVFPDGYYLGKQASEHMGSEAQPNFCNTGQFHKIDKKYLTKRTEFKLYIFFIKLRLKYQCTYDIFTK